MMKKKTLVSRKKKPEFLTLVPPTKAPAVITLTPEMAMALLETNKFNRPVRDVHVQRIARQIKEGRWRFNGDTIKISKTNDILDGQHRLWAVIEAKLPVETVIVYNIERDAFATIDTIRTIRNGADTISLTGTSRHRGLISSALTWLLRWQREVVESYRDPRNRIENSDIEEAFANHPGIVRAVEEAAKLRRLTNPSIIAFLFYVLHNRNQELAERMMKTLSDPSDVSIEDPFFQLRAYFTSDHYRNKNTVVTIALVIKAANAAKAGEKMRYLAWRNQGKNPQPFPKLLF